MKLSNNTLTALYNRGNLTDSASEYGEPGYSTDKNAVLLGTYWCENYRCPLRQTEGTHSIEAHYPRIMRKLEEAYELEWYDEWTVVDDKAYRTSPDSYSWTSSIQYTDDGEYLTPESPADEWVEWAKNDPSRAICNYPTADQLAELGFTEHECGLQSGWHPGQTDNPKVVARNLVEMHLMGHDFDYLFRISEQSQFYTVFAVYVKLEEESDED